MLILETRLYFYSFYSFGGREISPFSGLSSLSVTSGWMFLMDVAVHDLD